VSGIKRQVDVVVAHMLDLGKDRSGSAGARIINGSRSRRTSPRSTRRSSCRATEAGRRFAVVDEIASSPTA
jgi:hypothetical protein